MGAPEYRLFPIPSTRASLACGRLRSTAPAPLAERRRFAGRLETVMQLLPRFRVLDAALPQPAVLRESHPVLRLPACVIGRLPPGWQLDAHELAIADALAALQRARAFPSQPWAVARTSRYGLDLALELWSAAPGTRGRARVLSLSHRADRPAGYRQHSSASATGFAGSPRRAGA